MEAKNPIRDILQKAHKTASDFASASEGNFKQADIDTIFDGAYESIYKAGMKKVLEFKCEKCSTSGFVHCVIPVSKLKEWGI